MPSFVRSHVSRQLLTLAILGVALCTAPAHGQKAAKCVVTCSPDPTSNIFIKGTFVATVAPQNLRGEHSMFVPPVFHVPRRGGPRPGRPHAHANTGATTYDYAVPILRLPGRNGLDVNLTLFYNSRVWILDAVNNTMTFNADRDFPSYGFRLGYGFIETSGSNFLLTEPDGTKRQFQAVSGSTTMFTTVDSSYVLWDNTNHILTRKNGERWFYGPSNGPTILVPTKIEDTNGNFIAITYEVPTTFDAQSIQTITDTVGRTITFNYNANQKLNNITVTPPGSTTAKTIATFGWSQIALTYNFASPLSVVDSPGSGAAINLMGRCAYLNGVSYNFSYGDWGLVDKITLESAQNTVRSYTRYDYPTASAGALTDHPEYQHQIVSPDGTSASEIAYTYSVQKLGALTSAISVTDPPTTTSTAQKTTTTNLVTSGIDTGLVSSVVLSEGSTLLRTTSNTWTQDNTTGIFPINPRVTNVQTTLNDTGQNSQMALQYDGNGNVKQTQETDYTGNVSRITQTDYLTTSSYTNLHILDRPTQVRVYSVVNGSNNLISRMDLAYDTTSLTSVTGAVGHDDNNFGTGNATRGNLSSITRYSNAANATGAITRQFTYDTLGNKLTTQLDCCQEQQWGFASDNQFAYPETFTRGPSGSQLVSSATYDVATGLMLTSTDENGQETQFSYDSINRLKTVTRPGGIQTTATYDDNSAQPVNTSTTPIDSSRKIEQLTTGDGLGRVIHQETEDASGNVYSIVDTQYDALGRIAQVSNPHGSSETPVFTQRTYDALNRVLQIIPPDGSTTSNNTQFSYSGNSVTVTDPAGKQRKSFTDAVARLIEVDEPGGQSPGTQATGSLTISGSLSSIGGTSGSAGTGSVSLSGSEKSVVTSQATSGHGSFSISGAEQSFQGPPPTSCILNPTCTGPTIYNSGEVKVTIAGVLFSASYGATSTTSSVASDLANAISSSTNPQFRVSVSGATVSVTAKNTGSATNYAVTVPAPTFDSADGFSSSSFTASGSNFTGGADAVTTFDSGTVTVTVNGTATQVSYSSSSTTSSLASALASALSSGSLVNATASGSTISIAAKTTGSGTNYSLAVSSSSSNSSLFNPPSFSISTPNSSLTGGANAESATSDSGTLSVSVGSFTASGIPYGSSSNSTASQVASAVATALRGSGSPVTVTSVSSATINLTHNTVGIAGNVSVTVTPHSSNTSQFPSGSFASSGSLSGGANPVAPSLSTPQITTYAYDPLNDLTTVTQGVQTRTFGYDSLGRLTGSATPEAGNVSFTYTDFGAVLTRTDSRNVVTTYQYDALHRFTGISYTLPSGSAVAAMPNVCTPSGGQAANVCFAYGTSSSANNNGRLTQMTDPTGNEAYTYDIYGRVAKLQKTIGSTAYPLGYTYNFANELTQVTYPSGRAVTQTVDPIGRLNQIQSGGTNFLTINTTDYNAASEPLKLTLGNGVVGTMSYNARLQLATLAYAVGTNAPLMSLAYNYTCSGGTGCTQAGNDGEIQSISDNVDGGRSETFTYDAWNRLETAQTTGSANFPAWGLSWTYDRYGNRLAQNVTAGSGPPNSVGVDPTTNRINSSGYTYDAAGNMTNDGLNTMIYDGENRVASSTQASVTTNYTYDGNGLRIKKATGSNSTAYIFSSTKVLAEYDNGAAVASPSREYIYSGGRLLATIDSAGTKYHLSGHLSPHITTDTNGAVIGTQAHYPFGEKWYETGTTTKYKFTTYERDPETGNDYAIHRYHINRLGRFGSVDLRAGSISNPQSLNRYPYVMNNPINSVDPLGLNELEDNGGGPSLNLGGGGGDDGGDGGSSDNSGGVTDTGGTSSSTGDSGSTVGANCGFGSVCSDGTNLTTTADASQYQTEVAISLSDGTEPVIQTQESQLSNTLDNSLEGTILGQMMDSSQCSNCMSILAGADTATEALGWLEIGAASVLLTGGEAASASLADESIGETALETTVGTPAPDFVVTPNGEVIPVPEGATGPYPTQSPGFQFNGGAGGNGLAGNVTDVRIMNPNAQNPTGYVNYGSQQVNGGWQSVNPYTGQAVSPANPWWHIPID